MQTVLGEKYYERRHFETIRDLIRDCAERYDAQDAYRYHDKPYGTEIVHSYRDFADDIDTLGTALMHLGLAKKHIVVIGANCYEWAVAHNAVINGVGVSVPLDRQLPEPEVIHLTRRGHAEAFIYHPGHHDIALAVAADNPDVRYFICMKPDDLPEGSDTGDTRFMPWHELMKIGHERRQQGDRSFLDASLDKEEMCALLFTSGTTAMSKGVMLSHRNITSNIYSVVSTLNIREGQRALSILPLHHTFENTVGMYVMLSYGSCICFVDGLRYLSQNLKEWKIDIILAVPLLFENIYRQIEKNLEKSGKLKLVNTLRVITKGLLKVNIDVRRKLFHQILDALGGNLNLCVSGAAPIDRKIIAFFNEIGIDFFNGYGLTETSPVIAACNYHVNVYGSVGQPLAFIEAAIDTPSSEPGSTGEILTRSESVMLGYYENPDATAEVLQEDGWLRTGDVGYLDKNQCIHITGRAKSMIVLTNGKKVFPEEVEFLLGRIPGLRESIVWGERSSRDAIDICAKLVINHEDLPATAKSSDEALISWLEEQIKQVNTQMPPYKAVKYFIVSEQDLIKTTTLKIRRPQEQERIQNDLAQRGLSMKTAHGLKFD